MKKENILIITNGNNHLATEDFSINNHLNSLYLDFRFGYDWVSHAKNDCSNDCIDLFNYLISNKSRYEWFIYYDDKCFKFELLKNGEVIKSNNNSEFSLTNLLLIPCEKCFDVDPIQILKCQNRSCSLDHLLGEFNDRKLNPLMHDFNFRQISREIAESIINSSNNFIIGNVLETNVNLDKNNKDTLSFKIEIDQSKPKT